MSGKLNLAHLTKWEATSSLPYSEKWPLSLSSGNPLWIKEHLLFIQNIELGSKNNVFELFSEI